MSLFEKPSRPPDVRGLALTPDHWLAKVLSRPVYRVSLRRSSNDGEDVPDGAFLYTRFPADQLTMLADFAARGFDLVEVSVRLTLVDVQDLTQEALSSIQIRKASEHDAPAVADIAQRALRQSRFHMDPRIGEIQASRIKAEWAANLCLATRGVGCWVAHIDGQVIGFVGVVDDDPTGSVAIDLIALDPAYQRLGAGAALLHRVRNWAGRAGVPITTGTQIANRSAIRFYETCGFRFSDASFVLHAHALSGEGAG